MDEEKFTRWQYRGYRGIPWRWI